MPSVPTIEIITERPLFVAGQEQIADLLIRILPPEVDIRRRRAPFNLSLVMDRSGSMGGEKIRRAREAVCYCVDQLLPDDRVSVIIFDQVVKLCVPCQQVTDKQAIRERVRGVEAGGSTALHEAWVRGGIEVSQHLNPEAINRVILVTDGLANVGETRSDRIISQAGELAARGVSTTTIGIGDDFKEDLLIPMAEAGRGNAWHVREAAEMERIFATELEGLTAQVGHTVSLGFSPADGVRVSDVLNDFEVTHTGRYKLPNLILGQPIEVVVRLSLPAGRVGERKHLLDLRLAWNPQMSDGEKTPVEKVTGRREAVTQPVMIEFDAAAAVEQLPVDARLTKAVQMLLSARARREAIGFMDVGDYRRARHLVFCASAALRDAGSKMDDDDMLKDSSELAQMARVIEEGPQAAAGTRKRMLYQRHSLRRTGKSS
ncbi:MAG: VWA domain-containing protein [Blastocatellia bacterium]